MRENGLLALLAALQNHNQNAAMSGTGGLDLSNFSGSSWAEDWDPSEDDAEFGASASADDHEEVMSGPGRALKRLKKVQNKEEKWEERAAKARTPWGRKIAQHKAEKFSERGDKLAKKAGVDVATAAGGGGGGGFMYAHTGAPPMVGNIVPVTMYPKDTPSGVYSGATSQPLIKTSFAADGQAADIILQTGELPWAKFQIVGFMTSIKASRSDGAALYVKDLKTKNGSNLFLDDGYVDGDLFEANNREHIYGLRNQPVVSSPQRASVTCAGRGDNGDRIDFGCTLLVDIIEDEQGATPVRRVNRLAGAYAMS